MKLVHNSPISIKSDFKVDKNKDQVENLRDLKRNKERTQKPERVYFLWFLNLKLLLEMEEKKMCFKIGKSRKEIYVGKDLKIDKTFYKDWDLDQVLVSPFWKWWKSHKTLFEKPITEISDTTKGWKSKPYYRFIKIDTRNGLRSILKDVRTGLSDLVGKDPGYKSRYKVVGDVHYDNEILRYNVIIRILNGEDDMEILEKEKGRMKKIEKSKRGSIRYDDEVNTRESLLWTLERQWKNLRPEERGVQYTKVHEEVHKGLQGGLGKYRLKIIKTKGTIIDREFRSRLRMELSRYTKESQLILNGISLGKYRKQINF